MLYQENKDSLNLLKLVDKDYNILKLKPIGV